MASRFATGTNTDPGSVPIHTADDAQGNAAVGHVQMVETGGIAVPVSNTNPLAIGNPAIGSVDDTAFNGSGNSSIVAALKGVFSRLNATVTVSDTNTGTNVSTLSSTTGAPTDGAWSSGSGTVVSLLKAIASTLRATVAVNDTNVGLVSDAAYTSGNGSVVSLLKALFTAVGKNVSASPSMTDRSNLVAVSNNAQQILGSNANRVGFCIQPAADVYLSFTGTAVAMMGSGSVKIPAGSLYETPINARPVGAVSLICATQGATFALLEW